MEPSELLTPESFCGLCVLPWRISIDVNHVTWVSPCTVKLRHLIESIWLNLGIDSDLPWCSKDISVLHPFQTSSLKGHRPWWSLGSCSNRWVQPPAALLRIGKTSSMSLPALKDRHSTPFKAPTSKTLLPIKRRLFNYLPLLQYKLAAVKAYIGTTLPRYSADLRVTLRSTWFAL